MRKLIAFFISISFILTSIVSPSHYLYANPAGALSNIPSSHSQNGVRNPSDILDQLDIPSGIGSVSESFKGKDNRVVFLVQDAHAIPEAQKSIRRLIEYFQKQHSVDFVGLEGSTGRLDPLLLKNFPNSEILNSVFNEYLDRGELSGAAAASILNPEEILYTGIENEKLYEEEIETFLKAVPWQREFTEIVKEMEERCNLLKRKVYSAELLDLDGKIRESRSDSEKIFELFNVLVKLAGSGKIERAGKTEFPLLAAVLEGVKKEITARENPEAVFKLEKALRDEIERILQLIDIKNLPKDRAHTLNSKLQDYQTERLSTEEFLAYLHEACQRHQLPSVISKKISALIERQTLLKNMKAAGLFAELDRYLASAKETFFRNETERRLDRTGRLVELMASLAGLKLSLAEWLEMGQLEKTQAAALPLTDEAEMTGLEQSAARLFALFEKDLAPFKRFYDLALERDQALLTNLLQSMKAEKKATAIVVAGGFHTEGLMEEFKKQGISCAVISPAITEIPKNSRYFDYMQGRVSWQNYFEVKNGRIDLFKAFNKAVTDRLLGAGDTGVSSQRVRQYIRSWRDDVVRDLAKRGRAEETSNYTHFIDETALKLADPEKYEALRKEWLDKVKRFVERLRGFHSANKLTVENVMSLVKANTAAPVTANGGLDHFLMPASLYVQTTTDLTGLRSAMGDVPATVVSMPAEAPAAFTLGGAAIEVTGGALENLTTHFGTPAALRLEARDEEMSAQLRRIVKNLALERQPGGAPRSQQVRFQELETILSALRNTRRRAAGAGGNDIYALAAEALGLYQQNLVSRAKNWEESSGLSGIGFFRRIFESAMRRAGSYQSLYYGFSKIAGFGPLGLLDRWLAGRFELLAMEEELALVAGSLGAEANAPTKAFLKSFIRGENVPSILKVFAEGLLLERKGIVEVRKDRREQGRSLRALHAVMLVPAAAGLWNGGPMFGSGRPETRSFSRQQGSTRSEIRGQVKDLAYFQGFSTTMERLEHLPELNEVIRAHFAGDGDASALETLRNTVYTAAVRDAQVTLSGNLLSGESQDTWAYLDSAAAAIGEPNLVHDFRYQPMSMTRYFDGIVPKEFFKKFPNGEAIFAELIKQGHLQPDDAAGDYGRFNVDDFSVIGSWFDHTYSDPALQPIRQFLQAAFERQLHSVTWTTVAANDEAVTQLHSTLVAFEQEMTEENTWADQNAQEFDGNPVIYYSAEFAYHLLRGYGGGLGVLSGDHTRGFHDLGLGIKGKPDPKRLAEQLKTAKALAVGLFYQKGNFIQRLDIAGNQSVDFNDVDVSNIPIYDLLDPETGRPIIVEVDVPDVGKVKIMAKVTFNGGLPLLMGVTYDDRLQNQPQGKEPTENLYQARPGTKERNRQYQVLAAMRKILTDQLKIKPGVEHLNDNHPWAVVVQRVADYMKQYKDLDGFQDYRVLVDAAIRKARAGIAFTTHTPVPAGNEKTGLDIARNIIAAILNPDTGLSDQARTYAIQRLLTLGTLDNKFNLTAFLLNMSEKHNAVSALHGEVSQGMWKRLYAGILTGLVKIFGIVNSVHTGFLRPMGGYFAKRGFTDLFKKVLEKSEIQQLLLDRDHTVLDAKLKDAAWVDENVQIDEEAAWRQRIAQKEALFREMLRRFLGRSPQCQKLAGDPQQQREQLVQALLAKKGVAKIEDDPEIMKILAEYDLIRSFDPKALTIGFARRVATYKRLLLLLSDPERLEQIIQESGTPLQFVFAGRAHPTDEAGQELIREFHRRVERFKAKGLIKIVYVEEYDLQLARLLEGGVDVWLNNPVRPEEASGTSGMKVMINGGLNLSILDGWWAEACLDEVNGWAFGKTRGGRDDRADSEDLYQVLATKVLPAWKDRKRWMRMMKASYLSGVYRFGMKRMLIDYFENSYKPTLKANQEATTDELLRVVKADHAKRQDLLSGMAPAAEPVVTVDQGYPQSVFQGDPLTLRAVVDFKNLQADDFGIDLMMRPISKRDEEAARNRQNENLPLDENDTWTFLGAAKVEPLIDGKFLVSFDVDFPDYQVYEFKLRLRPKATKIFESSQELQQVSRYVSYPPQVEVLDKRLFQARAEDATDGRLFYLHAARQMPVKSVRFFSVGAGWQGGESIPLKKLASIDENREHDAWAVVVPKAIAQDVSGFQYAYEVTLEDGRKIRVPDEGRNQSADIRYGSQATWESSQEKAVQMLSEAEKKKADNFVLKYFLDHLEVDAKLSPTQSDLAVDGTVTVRLPQIAVGTNTDGWRFYLHYGFDEKDSISWKTIPMTAGPNGTADSSVLLTAHFRAPRYGQQLEYKIVAVPPGIEIDGKSVKSWSREVVWNPDGTKNHIVQLGAVPSDAESTALTPVNEVDVAREIMIDYMLGSSTASAMLAGSLGDRLVQVIETNKIFLGQEVTANHGDIHIYRAVNLPQHVRERVGELGLMIALCPGNLADFEVAIPPIELKEMTGLDSGLVFVSSVPVANREEEAGKSAMHFQEVPLPGKGKKPGVAVADLGIGEGLSVVSATGAEGQRLRVFGMDRPKYLTLLELFGRSVRRRWAEHNSKETPEEAISEILKGLERLGVSEETLIKQSEFGQWLEAITHMSPEQAQGWLPGGVPSIMAFIAAVVPSFLDKVKDWDPDEYDFLKKMITRESMLPLLEHGKFRVFTKKELGHKNGIVFSRTYQGKTIFFTFYPSGRDAHNEGKSIPITVKAAQAFGFETGKTYVVRDVGADAILKKSTHDAESAKAKGVSFRIPIKATTPAQDTKHGVGHRGSRWQFVEYPDIATLRRGELRDGLVTVTFGRRAEARRGQRAEMATRAAKSFALAGAAAAGTLTDMRKRFPVLSQSGPSAKVATLHRAELREKTSGELLAIAAARGTSYKRLQWREEREFVTPVPDGIPEIWASDMDYFRGQQWGRNSSISLPGMLLVPKRFEEAKKYLLKLGRYVSGGLIPDKIYDSTLAADQKTLKLLAQKEEALDRNDLDGAETIDRQIEATGIGVTYNGADASMWYMHAVEEYIDANPDDKEFQNQILPVLEKIIKYYSRPKEQAAARYVFKVQYLSVYMDQDGLIVSPPQATWMNRWPEGAAHPFTPRAGKVVEINAMWHAGLQLAQRLAAARTEPEMARKADTYGRMAGQVQQSFRRVFTNTEYTPGSDKPPLFDYVVDTDDVRQYYESNHITPDQTALRPNMLFAVSHGGKDLLDEELQKAVVQSAQDYLWTPYGMRTLAAIDDRYLGDFVARSTRSQYEKDEAAHQGAVFPWLIGAFIDAYAMTHAQDNDLQDRIREMLMPLLKFTATSEVQSIPEAFDGGDRDKVRAGVPFEQRPGGTRSQGWNVAEVLRVAVKYKIIDREQVRQANLDALEPYGVEIITPFHSSFELGTELPITAKVYLPAGLTPSDVAVQLVGDWNGWGTRWVRIMDQGEYVVDGSYWIYTTTLDSRDLDIGHYNYKVRAQRQVQDEKSEKWEWSAGDNFEIQVYESQKALRQVATGLATLLRRSQDKGNRNRVEMRAELRADTPTVLLAKANNRMVRYKNKDGIVVTPGIPELWAADWDWFFEQWGRDAFISLPGLLLVPKRFEEARRIMLYFGQYVSGGLIPNKIYDSNKAAEPYTRQLLDRREELVRARKFDEVAVLDKELEGRGLNYNCADASMWFMHAVQEYVKANPSDVEFQRQILPVLKNIIDNYSLNRDNASAHYHFRDRYHTVYMDSDGLIVSPEQATWMDAWPMDLREPVTPRRGKTVEINAMWYEGLRFTAALEREQEKGDRGQAYSALADKVRTSFRKKFWNPDSQQDPNATPLLDYVADTDDVQEYYARNKQVLEEQGSSSDHQKALRPNMVFAVTHSGDPKYGGGDLLEDWQQRAVIDSAEKFLLTDYGMRTLAKGDRSYAGNYKQRMDSGDQVWKDKAYHQGTVWPWPIGAFVDGYAKVHAGEMGLQNRIAQILKPLMEVPGQFISKSIAEVYDGDIQPGEFQHRWGGTKSQAWSVSEVLRVAEKYGLISRDEIVEVTQEALAPYLVEIETPFEYKVSHGEEAEITAKIYVPVGLPADDLEVELIGEWNGWGKRKALPATVEATTNGVYLTCRVKVDTKGLAMGQHEYKLRARRKGHDNWEYSAGDNFRLIVQKHKGTLWWEDTTKDYLVEEFQISAGRGNPEEDEGGGTFADAVDRFKYLQETYGINVMQMMPPFAHFGDSDYEPVYMRALNETLIKLLAIPEVANDPVLRQLALAPVEQHTSFHKEIVRKRKHEVLLQAFRKFQGSAEYDAFLAAEASWLPHYAELAALVDILGGTAILWPDEKIEEAKRDPRFRELVGMHQYAQFHAHAQCQQMIDGITELGGKVLFDFPGLRAKAYLYGPIQKFFDGIRDPNNHAGLKVYKGQEVYVDQGWGSLANYNYEALRQDDYHYVLDDFEFWLARGVHGARFDYAHGWFDFREILDDGRVTEKFGPGGEPGEDFVRALAALFQKYDAIGVAEAFERSGGVLVEDFYRRNGFLTVKPDPTAAGDWEQHTCHDDPRVFTTARQLTNELFRRVISSRGRYASFISFPVGALEGDTVPIKQEVPGRTVWEYRLPLPTDPGYSDRVMYDARPYVEARMALLKASQQGDVWKASEELAALLTDDAERYVRRHPGGRLATNTSHKEEDTALSQSTLQDFSGLFLARGRFEDARRILGNLAAFAVSGMVPNRLVYPDDHAREGVLKTLAERRRLLAERKEKFLAGDAMAVNGLENQLRTVNAELKRVGVEYDGPETSLWFIHAVREYLDYTHDTEFVRPLMPLLRDIADFMMSSREEIPARYFGEIGDYYPVYSDTDGLLVRPPVDQSRHRGKLVDVNALWAGSLDFIIHMENQMQLEGSREAVYAERLSLVKQSFAKFWNAQLGTLYDAIDVDNEGGRDDTMKPYQLLALTHAGDVFTLDQRQQILQAVKEELLTPLGVRTLSPVVDHYEGHAQNFGAASPWFLGLYLQALRDLRIDQLGHSPDADENQSIQDELRGLLTPLLNYFAASPSAAIPTFFEGGARRHILAARLPRLQRPLPQREYPLGTDWPNGSSSIAAVLSVIGRYNLLDRALLEKWSKAALQPYHVKINAMPVYDSDAHASIVRATVYLPAGLMPEDVKVQIWTGELVKDAQGRETWRNSHSIPMKLVQQQDGEPGAFIFVGHLPDQPYLQEFTVRASRSEMRTAQAHLSQQYRWSEGGPVRVQPASARWEANSHEAGLGLAAGRFVRYTQANGQPVPDGIPELWAADWDWFFEQWGRDSMISLPGLLLVTNRSEEARKVLLNLGRYVSGGLIPNKIWNPQLAQQPETAELLRLRERMVRERNFDEVARIDKELPAHGLNYNNADASMWFMHAVAKYIEYNKADDDFRRQILPVLRNIADNYSLPKDQSAARYAIEPKNQPTRYFQVYMDEDGLIVSPEGATWMDAWPEGAPEPITPRAGKTVEINAMWYAGLRQLEELEAEHGAAELSGKYGGLANLVRDSFREKFQNKAYWDDPKAAPLRDYVIKTSTGDIQNYYDRNRDKGVFPHEEALRPNMIFAVTHGRDLLEDKWQKAVVQSAKDYLLTPYGMRTLAKGDSNYKGNYRERFDTKNQQYKDEAYHQGTVWPWLIGAFVDAYAMAHQGEDGLKANLQAMLAPLMNFPRESEAKGVSSAHSIPEVFNGDIQLGQLHLWGGTQSQGWSVAEVLRVGVEHKILDREAVIHWNQSAITPYRIGLDYGLGDQIFTPQKTVNIPQGSMQTVPVRVKVYVPRAVKPESLDVNIWMTDKKVQDWNESWTGRQAAALTPTGERTDDGAYIFTGEIPVDQLESGKYPWIVRAGIRDKGQWTWLEGGNRQMEIRPLELPRKMETENYVRTRSGEISRKIQVRIPLAAWMKPDQIQARIDMSPLPLENWGAAWVGESRQFSLTKISGPDANGFYTYEAEIPVSAMKPGKYEYVPLVAFAGSSDWKLPEGGNSRLEIPEPKPEPPAEARPKNILLDAEASKLSVKQGETMTVVAKVDGGELDEAHLEVEIAGDWNDWGNRDQVILDFVESSVDGVHLVFRTVTMSTENIQPGTHHYKLRVRRKGTTGPESWRWMDGDNQSFEVKARTELRSQQNLEIPRAEMRTSEVPPRAGTSEAAQRVAHDFLAAWAGGTDQLMTTVTGLVQLAQESIDPVAYALTAQISDTADVYAAAQMRMDSAGAEVVQAIQGSDTAANERAKAPDYDAKAEAFVQRLVDQMDQDAKQFYSTHTQARDVYQPSFAVFYSPGIEGMLRLYVAKIKELQMTYGNRVKNGLGLIVGSGKRADAAFLTEMANAGVKQIEFSTVSAGVIRIQKFLHEHGTALVYGLEGTILEPDHFSAEYRSRIVSSRLTLRETMPVAMLLGTEFATISHVTAEMLKQVPQVVHGTVFNGQRLEVLESALDLVYHDYQTGQLIASMA